MTEPIRFQPGEPLSAASLNNALDYSRPQHAEIPNEGNSFFGSKAANGRSSVERERMILVRAIEDFAIRTTVCAIEDDVPSGRVEYVRLIPQLNTHLPPENQTPFYVYDPIAGLMEIDSKAENDVFHCIWNDDSGRWEVMSGGGGIRLYHGIITERCNQSCSTYRVQRVHRYITASCGSCSDSGSESVP